jgi:hypothetical protein
MPPVPSVAGVPQSGLITIFLTERTRVSRFGVVRLLRPPFQGTVPVAVSARGRLTGFGVGGGGQHELELAALSRLATDMHLAAMGVRDRADQGKPEPGTPCTPGAASTC